MHSERVNWLAAHLEIKYGTDLFYGACSQTIAFQILFDLALDQSTFRKAKINQITLALFGRLKEVQLCHLHIAKV